MQRPDPAFPVLEGILFDQREITLRMEQMLNDTCTSFKPHVRGNHHKTYIVTFANRGEFLLRVQESYLKEAGIKGQVPTSLLGSEIATMCYVKQNTGIPVPRVVLCDEDLDGKAGAPYMLLEYMPGIRLDKIWSELSKDQHQSICLSIVDIWATLLSLPFQSIGSLYNYGCASYVGPMTFRPVCDLYRIEPPDPHKCGPFHCVRDYLMAIARRDLDFLSVRPRTAEQQDRIDRTLADTAQASPFLEIDNQYKADICAASLEHVDLRPLNVLVDEADYTKITAVLDWEGARVVPFFAIRLPIFSWALCEDQEERARLTAMMHSELCRRIPHYATTPELMEFRNLYVSAHMSDHCPRVPYHLL